MGNGLGNKEIMGKNIQYFMDINNLSRQDLCKAIGVKYTTLTDWIKGNAYPRIDKIELMANYFGVSKSELVEERKNDESFITSDEFELIKKFRTLNIESQQYVINIVDREIKYQVVYNESIQRAKIYKDMIENYAKTNKFDS